MPSVMKAHGSLIVFSQDEETPVSGSSRCACRPASFLPRILPTRLIVKTTLGAARSGGEACAIRRPPVPREKLIEPASAVVVDASEHIGNPSLRIDVVEPRGLDQRVHHCCTLAAAIGAGEQP